MVVSSAVTSRMRRSEAERGLDTRLPMELPALAGWHYDTADKGEGSTLDRNNRREERMVSPGTKRLDLEKAKLNAHYSLGPVWADIHAPPRAGQTPDVVQRKQTGK